MTTDKMTFTKLNVCLIVSHAHHLLHLYLVSPLPLVSFSILIGLSNGNLFHCSSNHYWQNNDAEIINFYAVDMFLLFVFLQGGARVLAFDQYHAVLVVSKPSPNQLFPGFGIVKVNLNFTVYCCLLWR